MENRTGKEHQQALYRLVTEGSITTSKAVNHVFPYTLPFPLGAGTIKDCISGNVYHAGLRPRDSRGEDITVMFITGTADQVQSGVMTVQIWVPDIDPYDNGVRVEDMERTAQLERVAQDWYDSIRAPALKLGYNIKLQDTITTLAAEEVHQHFVSVMLKYKYFNN